MKTSREFQTIEQLVRWRKDGMASANPEYQRAGVWTPHQKKRLVDSVLREYQLPMIYLHFKDKSSGNLTMQTYDIIDGQQRLDALYEYVEGEFPVYSTDDDAARFPRILRERPCPWGGKYFQQLSDEYQEMLLNSQIPVAKIVSDDEDEVRDLFVRLQAGKPLDGQEVRDAYPGEFNEFILKMGGKPTLIGFPGHDFFKLVGGLGRKGSNRVKARVLAAQITMLFLERRRGDANRFVDITNTALDNYYHRNLGFDSTSLDCERLHQILDKLHSLFASGRRPPLRNYEAMSLVLFVEAIWDGYTRSWEDTLAGAHDKFVAELAHARTTRYDPSPEEAWVMFGQLAAGTTGSGANIRRRHGYYSRRMADLMGNLTPKDSQRGFGRLEREIVFWRTDGKCEHPRCGGTVAWNEFEIHHVRPHADGGSTKYSNAALVHSHCHPKSDAEVREFAENWEPKI